MAVRVGSESVAFLASIAFDGMALKPAAEFAAQVHGIVGFEDGVLQYERVASLVAEGSEAIVALLKPAQWVSQAVEVHATRLDSAFSSPLGVKYVNSKGGWKSVSEMDEEISEGLRRCYQCLKRAYEKAKVAPVKVSCFGIRCEACMVAKSVYKECSSCGQKEWSSMRHQCEQCKKEGACCLKVMSSESVLFHY